MKRVGVLPELTEEQHREFKRIWAENGSPDGSFLVQPVGFNSDTKLTGVILNAAEATAVFKLLTTFKKDKP